MVSRLAIRSHASRAVEQRKVRLVLRQKGQQLAERGQNCEAGIPPIAVAGAEQRDLPHHVRRRPARRQLTMHGLGNDEAEIMGEPVLKAVPPMARGCVSRQPSDR